MGSSGRMLTQMVLVKHKAKAKVMSLGMGPVEIGNGAIDGDGAKIGEVGEKVLRIRSIHL